MPDDLKSKLRKLQSYFDAYEVKQNEQQSVNDAIQAIAENRATHADSVLLMQKGKIPFPKPEKPKTETQLMEDHIKYVTLRAKMGLELYPPDSAIAKNVGAIKTETPDKIAAREYAEARQKRERAKWAEEDKLKPLKQKADSLSKEASIKRNEVYIKGKPGVSVPTKGPTEYIKQINTSLNALRSYMGLGQDANPGDVIKEAQLKEYKNDPVVKNALRTIQQYQDSSRRADTYSKYGKNAQQGTEALKEMMNAYDLYEQNVQILGEGGAKDWLLKEYGIEPEKLKRRIDALQ